VYFFVVFVFLLTKLTASAQAGGWCVPFSSSLFSWTFVMVYSKANLKAVVIKHLLVSDYSEYKHSSKNCLLFLVFYCHCFISWFTILKILSLVTMLQSQHIINVGMI
jgi:hypothetical protein